MENSYHYTECGLSNIYLLNGFKIIETPRGKSVSINDVDGLHKAIGLSLSTSKKNLSPEEIRFLRHELLLSQNSLARLLGVSEQAIRRWENGKFDIPKPSETLLRLLYNEHVLGKGEVTKMLKRIADLEDKMNDHELLFEDTANGWQKTAA